MIFLIYIFLIVTYSDQGIFINDTELFQDITKKGSIPSNVVFKKMFQ